MSLETKVMTAEELLRTPSNGKILELVDGEVRTMSPAGFEHGRIAMLIGSSLSNFVRERDLGQVAAAETGFLLRRNPDTVRAPDVAFVRKARLVQTSGYFPGAPDLAIEVISPSDTYSEVDEKVIDWLRSGVQLVIVIDPKSRTAAVHRALTESIRIGIDGALDGGDVVEGWRLSVRDLF